MAPVAARAVPIAWATMRPAPLAEPVLPARSRSPAITGAEPAVLIVVASGESPLPQDLLAGDLGVPVGGALFGVPVDRAQQRIDVDEHRLLGGVGEQVDPLTQRHQMIAQHRFELAGVTEGELPQQGSNR